MSFPGQGSKTNELIVVRGRCGAVSPYQTERGMVCMVDWVGGGQ